MSNLKDQILNLKREISTLEDDVERLSAMEQAVKIVLNGGYGAVGSENFRWYDETIAEGITATGQVGIRYITDKINLFINEHSGTTGKDYVVSSDTDSTVFDTILNTSIGDISIGDLYNQYTDESLELKTNKDSVRELIEPIKSASFDGEKVVFNNINYIMKHKVKKRMYEIKTDNSINNTSIIVTENHSVIVERNGILKSIEPANMNNETDYLFVLVSYDKNAVIATKSYEVIDLGIQEIDVYDIEVEGTHNFFGNDILVHNSVYSEVEYIVRRKWPDVTDPNEITQLIDDFAINVMGPYIDKCYEELAAYLNCDVNLFDMKREAIAKNFIIRAKKNYIMTVYDNEGVRFADPYHKMMGIEVVRTSHPLMVREALKEALIMVMNGNSQDVIEFTHKFKEEFMSAPISKIGSPRSIRDIEKYTENGDGRTIKKGIKGLPINVNAAIMYNKLIHKNNLQNKYDYIRNASKIKFLPLKEPNPINSHVIGFIDVLPPEFALDEYIDKETHFDKVYIKPLESFMVYRGWKLTSSVIDELFGLDTNDLSKQAVTLAEEKIERQKNKKPNVETFSLF